MTPSRRRLVTLLGLVAVSLFCVALVVVRWAESGSTNFMGLIWNLFLAWIPFVLAVAVYDRWRRAGPGGDPARGRRALAAVLPERAVHRHRLRPSRAQSGRAVLVRRGDRVGVR